jgi:hypothetical protein
MNVSYFQLRPRDEGAGNGLVWLPSKNKRERGLDRKIAWRVVTIRRLELNLSPHHAGA